MYCNTINIIIGSNDVLITDKIISLYIVTAATKNIHKSVHAR